MFGPRRGLIKSSSLSQSFLTAQSFKTREVEQISEVIGRFQQLKDVSHAYLCENIEVLRGKNDRIYVVEEHSDKTLKNMECVKDVDLMKKWAWQVVFALILLENLGIRHDFLCPENIVLFDGSESKNNVKLAGWSLSYLTKRGELVDFQIGFLQYLSPDFLEGSETRNGDLWALGTILLEIYLGKWPWGSEQTVECVKAALTSPDYLNFLADDTIDTTFKQFIQDLLSENVTLSFIFSHAFLKEQQPPPAPTPSKDLLLSEAFHIWCLTGGNVEAECSKQGSAWSIAPILRFPTILSEQVEQEEEEDTQPSFNPTYYRLPVRHSLDSLTKVDIVPYNNTSLTIPGYWRDDSLMVEKLSPQQVREKDPAYQRSRILQFRDALLAWPASNQLYQLAKTDVSPLYRGRIWAALLDVDGDVQIPYDDLDKQTETDTDRQLDLDIPRCHQYHPLLSSPTGQTKLRRILKAWLAHEDGNLVYWQGLDSVAATFLSVNFEDEALAFACFQRFVDKFLRDLLVHDNNQAIASRMQTLTRLLRFVDADLAKYCTSINLLPNLYAIPWFMTMFAHVFTLEKIYHVYDKLLLAPSSLPLFLALAIVLQLRDEIMGKEFNECMLLFGELSTIDIDKALSRAMDLLSTTPNDLIDSMDDFATIHDYETYKGYAIVVSGIPERLQFSNGHFKDAIQIELEDQVLPSTIVALKARLQDPQSFILVTHPDSSKALAIATLLSTKLSRVCVSASPLDLPTCKCSGRREGNFDDYQATSCLGGAKLELL